MAPWFTAAHMQQLEQKQHGSQSAHCLGSAGLGVTPDADSFLSGSWKVVPGGGGPPSTNDASHFLTSAWLLQFSGWLASNGACCACDTSASKTAVRGQGCMQLHQALTGGNKPAATGQQYVLWRYVLWQQEFSRVWT